MKHQKVSIKKLILTIVLFLLAILFLLPLLWMISSSLKTPMQVFEKPFRWVTDKLRFSNYGSVWFDADLPFWRSFLNSLAVSVASVVGQLIVASMAGYAFAKIPFKGRSLLFTLMMMTMMIPMQVLIIPRYMLFYQIGLYDTLWALIIPNFFNFTSIFLLRQFYMSLPNELMEAALIDGAGYFRIWSRIMLPLTRNGLISAAILAFISSWNEYLSALIFLPSKENYTVSLAIRYYLNDTAREYNLMMCAAASTIIPVVILYISMQKYFEDGVAASGVKG